MSSLDAEAVGTVANRISRKKHLAEQTMAVESDGEGKTGSEA